MSRRFLLRRLIAVAALSFVCVGETKHAAAIGIDAYHPVRTFALPTPNGLSGGNVLFDALPDGRLLLLNGATVSVEASPGTGLFTPLGDVTGFAPGFGPSFLAVSPDGARAATGSNSGAVVVFNTGNPTITSNYAMGDFTGQWIDNARLAVAGSGVQVLDTSTATVKTLIAGIGGFAGGVSIDAAGNLYASNGFDTAGGGSETGWIKAFAATDWEAALAANAPLNFETSGTPVADLLSTSPVGFDALGNMFVGGGDAFGGSGDTGYAALVDSAAIADALASPSATPPTSMTSPSSVLRKFPSPFSSDTPSWGYNNSTGELYLNYLYADGVVTVYAIPEPAAWALAVGGIAAIGVTRRRRPRRRAATACGVGSLLAIVAAQDIAQAGPYATEVVATTPQFGNVALYNDPLAVLGEPTRRAVNNDPFAGDSVFHVSVAQAAYNRDEAGNKILTTLSRRLVGGSYEYGSITVKFDQPILDDPANPYGIDFNVFGNSFYAGSDFITDDADLRGHILSGNSAEPARVSVSPDNVNWYAYASGPYGDTAFPTQGFGWSGDQFDANGMGWTSQPMDFTKPVNPALAPILGVAGQGLSAADAIGAYVGSGGGTGFDLAASGFEWIQYIRVEATPGAHGGEIDAFADVQPTRLGDALAITPANVAAGTPLYFQNADAPTQTAVLAEFTAVSDLAKLSAAAVSDATALVALDALANESLLASYQFDVSPLIGIGVVTYAADFSLQPGANYVGNGNDLSLLQWDGDDWNAVAFEFDMLSGFTRLEDWSSTSSTLAIVQITTNNPGDHDGDGMVDGADFLVWQQNLSSSGLEDWKTNFGQATGAGVAAATVPEPTAAWLALAALGGYYANQRRVA